MTSVAKRGHEASSAPSRRWPSHFPSGSTSPRDAASQGLLARELAERWEREYDQIVRQGRFRWSVIFYITCGRKPANERGVEVVD